MKWLKKLQRIYSELTVIILRENYGSKYINCTLGRECSKVTVLFQRRRFSSNFTIQFSFKLRQSATVISRIICSKFINTKTIYGEIINLNFYDKFQKNIVAHDLIRSNIRYKISKITVALVMILLVTL